MTNKNTIFKIILPLILLCGISLFLVSFTSAETSCPANTTVGENQATLVGEITYDGGDPNLEVWFEYGKTASYGLTTSHFSRYGVGAFCATVYNLEPCATYNFRAVAKNSAGSAYGQNQTFTTNCLPISVDLKANGSDGPITVSYTNNITLSWNSTNAASCQASGDWSGAKSTSGSETIQMNSVKAYAFTLTCKDSTGSKTGSDSVQVNVTPNLPTVITKPAVVTY